MPAPLYEVNIDGTDHNPLKDGFEFATVMNGISTLTCEIDSEDGSYRAPLDVEFLFSEDSIPLIGGLIRNVRERAQAEWGAPIVTAVDVSGFEIFASFRFVSIVLPAGTLESQLLLLEPYLTQYGASLSAGQVTGPSMPEFTVIAMRLDEVFNTLATSAVMAWRFDASKVFDFYVPGTDAAPVNLTESNGVTVSDIEVEQSRSDRYANRVIMQSPPVDRIEWIDLFSGDGTTTKFFLTGALTMHYGYVGYAGNNETLDSVLNVGNGATWQYDPADHSIERVVFGAPVSGTENIQMKYDGRFGSEAMAEDVGEQTAHGLQEIVLPAAEGLSKTVLQALADAELASRLQTFIEVTYHTYAQGLRVGQSQSIVESYRNLNGTFLITEVRGAIPEDDDTIRYTVKAIGANTFKGSWRDIYKLWAKFGSGTSTGAGTVSGVGVVGTLTGPIAARPSAGTAGRLYFPTDSIYVSRDKGSVWENWGTIQPILTPPDDTLFTWQNQGVATIESTYGYPYMETAVTGSTATLSAHQRLKAAPAGAFTITAIFVPQVMAIATTFLGFVMRETSSGKLQTYGFESGFISVGISRIFGLRWTSDTTRGTLPAWGGGNPHLLNFNGGHLYMRVVFDGSTMLEGQLSKDGQHWITTATIDITLNSFMSAIDEYGWFISAECASGNPNVGCACVHWVES